MGIIFRKIKRAQTGVEMKVEPFGVTGLGITEASKLLSISKNKFNLKPGLVVGENLFGMKVGIGGKEKHHPCFRRLAGINQ